VTIKTYSVSPYKFRLTCFIHLILVISIHYCYIMKNSLSLGMIAILVSQTLASDDAWFSPVYKEIFQNELPTPQDKVKSHTYTNTTTGNQIHFYEVDVQPFLQQVYKGLKLARPVGYDGVSPGPTFRMARGREAIVRFKNHGDKDLSVHLHGSYSRAPFDGWAEDTTKPGQYKTTVSTCSASIAIHNTNIY
jgi:bilirubin oxidase